MLTATVPEVDPVELAGQRPAASGPDRTVQTVRILVGGGLLALALLVSVGYLVGDRLAQREALAGAGRFTKVLGETVVAPHVTPAFLAGDRDARARLARVVREKVLPETSVVRVKVWSAEGRVLYSDEPSAEGKVFALTPRQLTILETGRPSSRLTELRDAENGTERALGGRLVEVYTPITTTDGTVLLFEAYLGYDEVRGLRSALLGALSLMSLTLVVVFVLILLGLGQASLRWIRRSERALERRASDMADHERRSVARDLHDGAVQELVGLSFLIDGAAARVPAGDLPQLRAALDQCATSVQASIQALRATMVEVYPRALQQRGLGPALDDLAQPLRSRGTRVTLDLDTQADLDRDLAEACYRTCQEALRNVTRHAQATEVGVSLRVRSGRLILVISDDGVGMDADTLGRLRCHEGHLGLQGLADAALERQGRLVVRSAVGHGTELTWEVRT